MVKNPYLAEFSIIFENNHKMYRIETVKDKKWVRGKKKIGVFDCFCAVSA